ncbi:hypothetical protein [Mycolicibacterium madagascariense]|uniref:hypothetical protein n=1 Tax=Mycolicibacterium madagascariense TaxID=212765 RepID=UPI0013D39AC0|nr:hypothetical protein [Mycolicibacterium madagascariense]MCV7010921.1 hypothetical protein [Mycolicibacterium madagascariense]
MAFGIAMAVCGVVLMSNVTLAVRICAGFAVGAPAGVCFGLFVAWIAHGEATRRQDAIGHLPDGQRQLAVRSASRGPAPADEAVRHAALRMAEDALHDRWSRLSVVTFSALSIQYVLLALTSSSWWWLACAFFVSLLVSQVFSRRQVKRRVAILSAARRPSSSRRWPGRANVRGIGPHMGSGEAESRNGEEGEPWIWSMREAHILVARGV